MNRWTKLFCKVVSYLDYIPRYGRLYRWDTETDKIDKKPHWRFMWHGHWGLDILDDMGLLWKYIDELNPEFENEG